MQIEQDSIESARRLEVRHESARAAFAGLPSSRSFASAATFLPVRGNLDTRLRKLDSGDYDALVLAAAGLRRLERGARISALLPVELCVPAPGQGIIAVEIRQGDARTAELIKAFDDASASVALRAERAVVDRLGGGCQMPIGAFAQIMTGDETVDHEYRGLNRRVPVGPRHCSRIGPRAGTTRQTGGRQLLARRRREHPGGGQAGVVGDGKSSPMKNPAVYLIGTGPGDPGLITVHGLECLRRADVVIHDHEVPTRILKQARQGAELIDVGSSGRQPMEQDAITFLLADKAREGKLVARLKRGDPFVFDRGGEEALFLHAQGIPYEVVPGIPLGIGVPAYAGVPVTYPGGGDTITLVRGYEDDNRVLPDVDWSSLAKLDGTVVCYVGSQQLSRLFDGLIAGGWPTDGQAVIVYNGTLTSQITVTGTIAELASRAHEHPRRDPAIVVVGRVVALPKSSAMVRRAPAVRQARARHAPTRSGGRNGRPTVDHGC